jgi:hypothetical protein
MNLETLNDILEKIDDMKQDMPEGLYLHLMNDLKKRYDQLKTNDNSDAIYITFTNKDVIVTLVEATVFFLKHPIFLKELWDKEKEDFGGNVRQFFNYKFTLLIDDRPEISTILFCEEFYKRCLKDDLLDLVKTIIFLSDLSTLKNVVEIIPELRKYNFRKLNIAFANKFFNIKIDIAGLKKAGYIMGHVNAKNYKKMHRRNMLNNRK